MSFAVIGRQIDVVRALLAKGADPNKRSRGAGLPLSYSLRDNQRTESSEIAMLLIDRGADVNAADPGENMPLLLAVQGNQVGVVRALLAKGADPNAMNRNRLTPLTAATALSEIRQLLINAGAKQ